MAASAAEVIRPLRRVEYDKLVALGVFAGERIELIEGALVQMTPIGPPHSSTVQRLNELLVLALHGRASVRCQLPLAANEFSEPEPDFTVVPLGEYDVDHPSIAHVVIEVADSSLAFDRGKKLRLYARCAVPEYWVVNVPERCIEVYTNPSEGGYAHVQRYEQGQSIRPLAFTDLAFAVSEILK